MKKVIKDKKIIKEIKKKRKDKKPVFDKYGDLVKFSSNIGKMRRTRGGFPVFALLAIYKK